MLKELPKELSVEGDFLFNGRVLVACFGKEGGDWKPDHLDLIRGHGDLRTIVQKAQEAGAHRLQFPSVGRFNALVIGSESFPKTIHRYEIPVDLGIEADGAELPPGYGRAILPADCPTIIMNDFLNKDVIVGHGGMDSLFDRAPLTGKDPALYRAHNSVVDAMMERVYRRQSGFFKSNLYVHISCGIQSGFCRDPDHLEHGEYNERLLARVRALGEDCVENDCEILLHRVIRAQFVAHGVPAENISWDDIDTGADPRWWSQARGESERNLVLVVNHTR